MGPWHGAGGRCTAGPTPGRPRQGPIEAESESWARRCRRTVAWFLSLAGDGSPVRVLSPSLGPGGPWRGFCRGSPVRAAAVRADSDQAQAGKRRRRKAGLTRNAARSL